MAQELIHLCFYAIGDSHKLRLSDGQRLARSIRVDFSGCTVRARHRGLYLNAIDFAILHNANHVAISID
jgi:hypothetical protein